MSDIPGLSEQQLLELIALVKKVHGFDFSDYSKPSLLRRLSRIVMLKKMGFDGLMHNLLHDARFFQWFLEEITVNVTEMFRDPSFFKSLNAQVVPYLSSFEHI